MGQYYIAVFLNSDGRIVGYVQPFYGSKLMEHSYLKDETMTVVEGILHKENYRLVWAGDYADPEEYDFTIDEKNILLKYLNESNNNNEVTELQTDAYNLYGICGVTNNDYIDNEIKTIDRKVYYRYIINHSKKKYIDKSTLSDNNNNYFIINPLSILTADGNGRGGGDYKGYNKQYAGCWIKDVITVDNIIPNEYTLFSIEFAE
jgi:hypothetical protein